MGPAWRSELHTSKGIGRQGVGSFVRDSYVSTLRPVVIRPYLCTSEAPTTTGNFSTATSTTRAFAESSFAWRWESSLARRHLSRAAAPLLCMIGWQVLWARSDNHPPSTFLFFRTCDAREARAVCAFYASFMCFLLYASWRGWLHKWQMLGGCSYRVRTCSARHIYIYIYIYITNCLYMYMCILHIYIYIYIYIYICTYHRRAAAREARTQHVCKKPFGASRLDTTHAYNHHIGLIEVNHTIN